jgi:hypothetical protein
MIVTVASALLLTQTSSVADFFPLVPGTTWEYQEVAGFNARTYKDVVGEPVEVGGKMAYPVISMVDKKEDGRMYYMVEGNTLFLVAYDANKPLGSARPIVKFGPGTTKWEFEGDTMFLSSPAAMKMKCQATLKGKKEIFGKEVEMLEVRFEGQLGEAGTSIRSNQVAYYAKGIGLYEMLSDNTIGQSKSKSSLKLLKFVPGKRE